MPRTSAATVLQMDGQHPVQPEQITTWKIWAKVGAVFAVTTGACLLAKSTGAFSWVSSLMQGTEGEQDDALTITDENDGQLSAFAQPLTKTDKEITEILSPSVIKDQKSSGLKLAEFEEMPMTRQKRAPSTGSNSFIADGHYKKDSNELRMTYGGDYDAMNPKVAKFDGERFVITWSTYGQDGSGEGVYAQRYNADGTLAGGVFRVNQYTTASQSSPAVKGLTDGNFIITWNSMYQVCGGLPDCNNDIYGQIYNSTGGIIKPESSVNTYTDGNQAFSSVTLLPSLKYVVAWRADYSPKAILAQMFWSNGNKYGGEFQVDTGGDDCFPPSVSMDALTDGKYIVVWPSGADYAPCAPSDGTDQGIYGQMFIGDSPDDKYNSEFLINTDTYTYGWESGPKVAGLGDGKFVVVWDQYENSTSYMDVYGQIYYADGTTYGSNFLMNTHRDNLQYAPSIASLNNERFVVVWTSNYQDGDEYGIFGQICSNDGAFYGSEFQVNTFTANNQITPDITVLSNRRFVVVWGSRGQDTSYYNIYAQIYRANIVPTIVQNSLTVNEGEIVVVDNSVLSASDADPEDDSADLTFNIIDLQNGQFEFVGNGTTTTEFTQQHITNRNIRFIHLGGKIAPSYNVTVTDGGLITDTLASMIMFNSYPTLVSNILTIDEGQTVLLNSTYLSATDVESADETLTFSISNDIHGQFELESSPSNWVTTASFTQQQITDNQVRFVHDGSKFDPACQISVSDSALITSPTSAVINFFTIDNLPVLTTNFLMINQGQDVTLTNLNLAATDEETNNNALIFTAIGVQHGRFTDELQQTINVFSQQQITDGNVHFIHDNSCDAPSYTITVYDGALTTQSIAATIYFPGCGGPGVCPTLVNNQLPIGEGGIEPLSSNDLSATDSDSTESNLIFEASNVQHGYFEVENTPSSWVVRDIFSQRSITDGKVRFVHDSGELEPIYNITVSDGDCETSSSVVNINWLGNINDAPELSNNQLTLSEGDTVIFSTINLNATDVDSPYTALEFTISNVANGQFELVSTPGQPIFPITFTQQDVVNSNIQFVHDGLNDAPAYDVVVSDGTLSSFPSSAIINFTPENDAPFIQNNQLTIEEGQELGLTTSNLAVTDEESDEVGLTFNVVSVLNGNFERVNGPSIPIMSFTQSQVTNREIQFVHNGETAPSYNLTVTDGINQVQLIGIDGTNINFTPMNDVPELSNNQLTLSEGDTVIFSTINLNAIDVDSPYTTLEFTISNVANGQFELVSTPSQSISTFTQQNVVDGDVQFVHDGLNDAPAYDVVVSDGTLSSSPSSAIINFTPENDAPLIQNNQLTIEEGQELGLTTSNFAVTDEENSDSGIRYIVSQITGGHFERTGTTTTETVSFTQEQINNNEIRFVHNGEEAAPTYNLTVTDGENMVQIGGVSGTNIVFTTVNDAPILGNNNLAISQGGTIEITENMLSATDVDNDDADLTFTITNVQHGTFEEKVNDNWTPLSSTNFIQQRLIAGEIRFKHDNNGEAPSYSVTVSDGDLTVGPEEAYPITFAEKIGTEGIVNIVGGIVGGIVGIGGLTFGIWEHIQNRRLIRVMNSGEQEMERVPSTSFLPM